MKGIEFVGKILRARDEQKRIIKECKNGEDYIYNLGKQAALEDVINWIKQE